MGDDAERDEVVHLLDLDLLALQFLADAPQALDAAVDLDHRHRRLAQLGRNGLRQLLDQALGLASLRVDLRAERLVGLRLEIAERQLLELVLDLAHPEAVRNRGVDVARFLGDRNPALIGQVAERPHVVHAIGKLHEDDADVIHHRQQHLAEVLRLPLLARGEADGADLRHAFDDVGHFRAEKLVDPLDRGQRVLDDVVQQARGDRHDVELHVCQEVGHREGVDQVGFPRMADLTAVLGGREHIRPAQELDVGVRAVGPDFFEEVFEPNHGNRCLNSCRTKS